MKLASRLSIDRAPVLDLENTHFATVHRGIRVIGTWYLDPDTRVSEACLVLMDATKGLQRKGLHHAGEDAPVAHRFHRL